MKFTFPIFFSFLAFLSLGSNASFPVMAASLSQSGLLSMEISGKGLPEMPGGKVEVPSAMEAPREAITLKQALSLALMKNPELQSFSLEIRAREARILQSGLILNPVVQFEVENFFGSKEFRRFDGAETTLSLSQAFQLGGKRFKRVRLTASERDLAKWDYEAKRLDVFAEVTKAFIDTVAKQERVKLAENLVRLAEQSYNTVVARVQAGKVSPIDEKKASAALSLTRLEFERARHILEASKKLLSATWGSSSPLFKKAEGQLILDASLPPFENFRQNLEKNPDLARWASEFEQRKSAVALEEANRFPDLSLAGGVRRLNEFDETAYLFGVSLPIPFFNQNQGAVREAKNRLLKSEMEQKVAILRVHSNLTEAYQRLSSSFVEATTLKNEVLPALQDAFASVQEGYRFGKFGYLDVQDTQRIFFESNNQYIEALAIYRKAFADIERLTGGGIGGSEGKE
jgi:cobalt-zinc-cadmium efflux system outer membrane protein